MKNLSNKISLFKDSIFGTMSKLARDHQAINLSQGFPDFDGPQWIKDLASQKINEGHNQYAPFPGTMNLRNSIANYYKSFYNLQYNPETEITVSAGATEALYLAITALVNPGDEVIILEPFYDSYLACIQMNGGTPVPVTLHGPDFNFDLNELKKAITPKTKVMMINTPHNPTGKVFSREELKEITTLVREHDLYLISDEVYEFLLFDAEHIPSATFDGLKERTITISSAGKTFGLTGWKIGWACAPEKISHAMRLIHQYVTFAVSTPIQEAVSEGLKNLPHYIPEFQKTYREKRDYFYSGLKSLGFDFKNPRGTYFMMVPITGKTKLNDVDFAMKLVKEFQVATVPPSAFYLKSTEGQKFLRFCFAKKKETLESALNHLKRL